MAPLAANLRERRLGLGIAVSEGAISSIEALVSDRAHLVQLARVGAMRSGPEC
jgi:hypothetical protein